MTLRVRRVLVVEDNPLNLELVRDLLESINLSVEHAATAEEGLRMAAENPPDLILMDLRLPGLDGYQALERLRSDPRTVAVPTIAITADAMKGEDASARAAGFDDYLTKPIDTRAFPEIILRHIAG